MCRAGPCLRLLRGRGDVHYGAVAAARAGVPGFPRQLQLAVRSDGGDRAPDVAAGHAHGEAPQRHVCWQHGCAADCCGLKSFNTGVQSTCIQTEQQRPITTPCCNTVHIPGLAITSEMCAPLQDGLRLVANEVVIHAGTGKTAIMRDKLAALDADAMATANINMNSLSDAPSVQLILEQHLEKKSGALGSLIRTCGPTTPGVLCGRTSLSPRPNYNSDSTLITLILALSPTLTPTLIPMSNPSLSGSAANHGLLPIKKCLLSSTRLQLPSTHRSSSCHGSGPWCAGVRYGPPGGKRLVYFVDDMNMALVDKYDTQSAIEIMRQSIDYRGWFEKSKIFLKERDVTGLHACPHARVGCLSASGD